jgi:Uma2 family endonuclease
VVFEVLSSSTRAWDRGGKFHPLQQVGSLRHTVLLTEAEPRVEVFTRDGEGGWRLRSDRAGEDLGLDLGEGAVELAVDALYRELPEEAARAAAGPPSPT